MNFVSTFFLFYFIVIFLGNWLLRKKIQLKNIFLLVSSYVFYATWNWRFLVIIFVVSLVSYLIGKKITLPENESTKKNNKIFLIFGLILNLGTLGVFKYYDFFRSSIQSFLYAFHINSSLPLLNIILPIGLSFYIFRTISYIIDKYGGCVNKEHSFLDFMLYVAYFPQLLSGPIMRFNHFLHEIRKKLTAEAIEVENAIVSILSGLFKKVVLASYLSMLLVDDVFAVPINHSGFEALIAVFAYTMQIYLDFSGYTDISNGISLLLGIKPPVNFKQPYISASPSGFWRRWHITLSQWLRDYLYIPLGGNRVSKLRKYLNLMVTMLLGGLWHGGGWQFVVWGGIHGFGLVIGHVVKDISTRFGGQTVPQIDTVQKFNFVWLVLRLFGWFLTFNLVSFAWIFFRASSLQNALDFIRQLTKFYEAGRGISIFGLVVLLISFILHFVGIYVRKGALKVLKKFPLILKILIVGVVGIIILELGPEIVPPFIYFKF